MARVGVVELSARHGKVNQEASEMEAARLLHTMIRVSDLERSLEFYCSKLGMRVLRRTDYPEGRFTLAFVGYGEENEGAVIELTYNWGQREPYTVGDSWGHIAIGVKDIYKVCNSLNEQGVRILRPPGPMKHGSTVIAFIEDPDGRQVELIQN